MDYLIFIAGIFVSFLVCGGLFYSTIREFFIASKRITVEEELKK